MEFITHKIDTYILRECPSDKHDLIIEATKVIVLYSGENHVASAYFTEENFCSPDAIFSEGKIHFYAPAHQYETVIEQLSMGKSIYIECQLCFKKSGYDIAVDIGKKYIQKNKKL